MPIEALLLLTNILHQHQSNKMPNTYKKGMKFIKTYIINKNSNLDFFFLKEKIQRKIVTIKEKNKMIRRLKRATTNE